MEVDRRKHDQDIITAWMGFNGSKEYILELVNKGEKTKNIENNPDEKRNEWMKLARAFGSTK